MADLDALTIADIVALQTAEEHGHEVVLPRGGSLLDQLGAALQEIERLNNARADLMTVATGVLTTCRECRDELPFMAPVPPAEFIIWGKLAPPEALGPKCYDHAVKHWPDLPQRVGQYAAVDLRPIRRALVEIAEGER